MADFEPENHGTVPNMFSTTYIILIETAKEKGKNLMREYLIDICKI